MYMHIYSHIFMEKYIYLNDMDIHAAGLLHSKTRISLR